MEEKTTKRPVMSREQQQEIVDKLVEFTKRVADGNSSNDNEVLMLPEITRLLLDTRRGIY